MTHYDAPWSTSLIMVSSVSSLLCVGLAISFLWSGDAVLQWVAVLPLAIICGAGLFTIRGYAITTDAILVHRLLWATQLPLTGLQSARLEPGAMRGSIRTFGNGGLFSFTGRFRSKSLGAYRAFVTDPQRTVVLRFPARTIIVSPADPEAFIDDIGGKVNQVKSMLAVDENGD